MVSSLKGGDPEEAQAGRQYPSMVSGVREFVVPKVGEVRAVPENVVLIGRVGLTKGAGWRLDETRAIRKPVLRWTPQLEQG